ncbi:MAG: hypothetical protein ACR2PL_12740 [Dehalococcoidia bacterium]
MLQRDRMPRLRMLVRLHHCRMSVVAWPSTGAAGGFVLGAIYTLSSAKHMVLLGAHDLLILGVLLSVLTASVGWLAGLQVGARQDRAEALRSMETGNHG